MRPSSLWERRLHRGVWLFAAGAMAGFLLESLDSLLTLGYLQNRQGMLYGPFSPIYGLGALLLAAAAPRLRARPVPVVFLASALLGAAAEYLCALVQERAFGVRFWDYTGVGLDLHGRVNLVLTLCWGGLGVFFLLWLWPRFSRFVDSQPRRGLRLVSAALLLFFLWDAGLSAAALVRQNQRRWDLPAATAFGAYLDVRYPDQVLEDTFPTMTRAGVPEENP